MDSSPDAAGPAKPLTPQLLLLYSRCNMSMGQDEVLFGRIALHYKLVSQDQLAEATSAWSQEGGLRGLGEILVERGALNLRQLEQLRAAQRDYLAKELAKKAQQQGQAPASPAPAPPPVPAAPTPQAGWQESSRRLDALLTYAVSQSASDLHLHCGAPIKLRRNGTLFEPESQLLAPQVAESLIREIMTPEQQRELDEHGQIDFAYTISGVGRFRANAYRQQRGLDAVFRAIPPNPPTLEDLGLPSTLARFANFHQGMVLLTGPAGCGKSSTLAAMVNIINRERQDHIITIEDPIEYIHRSQKCVVNQRQVLRHTNSFARALRAALREDPDVIAIGELRDLETISLALTAAETGHLVLATLHTNNAIRTINRILGVFPPSQQEQIRTMVSESLRAVISQRLVVKADGSGRVPALEVLVCNKAVGNLIRDNKTFQIKSVLQTGSSQGMCLLDASLADLVKNKVITREEAMRNAEDPAKLAI
ncbi:MAG TPA: type IV pilus twitching motility protein PilT [Thermoanaerobaculia bacterium]|nr:type IV pilus twitching motility protein PilT [Thermoanaerobaculia bacterium]